MGEHDTQAQNNRPYFLWDYDLTEAQVHEILRGDDEVEKAWASKAGNNSGVLYPNRE